MGVRISCCLQAFETALKFLVDFGVWFPRWIFGGFLRGFFGPFSLGKIPPKIPPKNPRFLRQLFDQNPLREISALTDSKIRGPFASHDSNPYLSVATPAEPRGEKKLFFVQILGGEKLLKFVEKCR